MSGLRPDFVIALSRISLVDVLMPRPNGSTNHPALVGTGMSPSIADFGELANALLRCFSIVSGSAMRVAVHELAKDAI
jgi:hypothetical protein